MTSEDDKDDNNAHILLSSTHNKQTKQNNWAVTVVGVLLFTLLFELTSVVVVVVVVLEAPWISGAVVCAVAKRGDVSTTSYILTPCGLVCKPTTLFIIKSSIFLVPLIPWVILWLIFAEIFLPTGYHVLSPQTSPQCGTCFTMQFNGAGDQPNYVYSYSKIQREKQLGIFPAVRIKSNLLRYILLECTKNSLFELLN